jgi:ribosomal protein L11 methyltransferase
VIQATEKRYQDLYIYALEGMLSEEDESFLGEAFLGNWVEENSSFLFFSEPAGQIVAKIVKRRPGLQWIDEYHFTYEQWQGGNLETVKVADFLIAPPGGTASSAQGEIVITLDPGVVFGNGLHPTTRDCMRALALAGKQRPLEKVLDLGTGSGVLAVAAAFLGAEKVVAVDLNPLCTKTAGRNVKLNGVQQIVKVVTGPAESYLEETADLVIANMPYEVIRNLLERRSFLEGERWIVSGLMRTQARDVIDLLKRRRLRIIRQWEDQMTWYTFFVTTEGNI